MTTEQQMLRHIKNLIYELNRTNLLFSDLVAYLELEGALPKAVTNKLLEDCIASQKRLKQLEPKEKI